MSDTFKVETIGVELQLEQTRLQLEAGSVGRQHLKLINHTPLLANFDVSAKGVPSAWSHFSQTNVNLFPTWSETVELEISVPSNTPVGRYALEISVKATGSDVVQSDVRLDLEVTAAARPNWPETAGFEDVPTRQAAATSYDYEPGPPTNGTAQPRTQLLSSVQPAPPAIMNAPATTRLSAQSLPDAPPAPVVQAEPQQTPVVVETDETPSGDLPVATVEDLVPTEENRLELTMPLTEMSLLPGENAVQEILIRNMGNTTDQLDLFVQGLPPDWYSFSRRALSLFPGWTETIQFTIAVPDETYAAHYPGQFAVIGGQPKRVLALADFAVNVREKPVIALPMVAPTIQSMQPMQSQPMAGPPPIQPFAPPPMQSQPMMPPPYPDEPRRSFWQKVFKPNEAAAPYNPTYTPPPQAWPPPQNGTIAPYPPQPAPPYPYQVQAALPIAPVRAIEAPPVPPAASEPAVPEEEAPLIAQMSGYEAMTIRNERVILPARPMPVEEEALTVIARLVKRDLPTTVEGHSLRLSLEKPMLSIFVGGFFEQQISLTNLSSIPDTFKLEIIGLPTDWVHFSGTSVNLFPNWTEQLYVRIDVPPTTEPDFYEGLITVRAVSQPDEINEQIGLSLETRLAEEGLPVEQAAPATTEERAALHLQRSRVRLVVGEVWEQQVELVNPTGQADTFTLDIEGIPPEWYSFSCLSMTLFPGWSEEFYLRLQIPEHIEQQDRQIMILARPGDPEKAPIETSLWLKIRPDHQIEPALPMPTEATPALTQETGIPIEETADPDDYRPQERVSLAGLFSRPTPTPVVRSSLAPTATPTPELASTPPVAEAQLPVLPVAPSAAVGTTTPGANSAPQPQPIEDEAGGKHSWWQRLTGNKKEEEDWPSNQQPVYTPISGPIPAVPTANLYAPTAAVAPPLLQPAPMPPGQNGAGEPIPARLAVNDLFKAPPGPRKPVGGNQANSKVQIILPSSRMTIIAGESIQQQIGLMNMTSLPDNFDLTIEGLPDNWYKFSQSSVNLFPNWNEPVNLGISLSDKVRPNLYTGKIIAISRTQPGVRNEMPIEIEVLAPLKAEARLQPHRAKGFKAHYNLIVRNRSMSEGIFTLALTNSNEFCQAEFKPNRLVIPPGQSQTIPLTMQLRPKTPGDQARQSQPFEVEISLEWNVAGAGVKSPPVIVEGDYIHESRWEMIFRHPRIFIFGGIILLILALWFWLIVPVIQGAATLVVDRYQFKGPITGRTIFVEQRVFSENLQALNPFGAFAIVDVRFKEAGQETELGIRQPFVNVSLTMRGQLKVNDQGDIFFKAVDPPNPETFPWLFAPPNKIVDHVDKQLRKWIKDQAPNNRIDQVAIEGTTLFVRLAPCKPDEKGCNGA